MDPLTVAMFGVLAVLVFFTWRSSRKRKAAAEEQKASLQPGVEIMTNFGLYGTVLSIDTATNIAEIEVSPGMVLRIHPGSIAKVISDSASDSPSGAPRSVEEAMAIANAEAEARDAELNAGSIESGTDTSIDSTTDTIVEPIGEPEFGERTEDAAVATPKKPVRRTSAKKSTD